MTVDFSQLTDAQLASHARMGSQLAYREFLTRYKAPIYRLICNYVGDPDEALDLVQEAFVSAFAAIDRYDGSRAFRVWMSRIAVNKCRDWARRRKVRAFFSAALPLEKAFDVASAEPLPDEELSERGQVQEVYRAMDTLPDKLREVLILRAIDEMSQAEAATVLGVSEKTVETRLYRARLRMRDQLGDLS